MNFAAIDVELANHDMSSICQIGVAHFENGVIVDEWESRLDPDDDFDAIHTAIHGVTALSVQGQPKLPQIADRLRRSLEPRVAVSHSGFDRLALRRAFEKYQLQPLSSKWLDSAKVARGTWADVKDRGYGLANLCRRIGYDFSHHDALQDAKAAGAILISAMRDSGAGLDHWLQRTHERAEGRPRNDVALECNPNGELCGETLVFTGALAMTRAEASALAATAGCRVEPSVTKRTTLLVVGDQDLSKLAGHSKSSKHRKAEQLAGQGHSIRILRESDFRELLRLE